MLPIEQASLDNKLDVLKMERAYIEALHATLNSQIPSRTEKESKKEYREKNKERIHQQHKNIGAITKRLYIKEVVNII